MMCRLRAAAAALVLALLASAMAAEATGFSPATTNGWFTVIGRTAGGATRSDLWLFNPDTVSNVIVTLIFHPAVTSGGSQFPPITSSLIVLAARETKYFQDVTSSPLAAGDGVFGALEWQSNGPVLGVLRNVTVAGAGTSGPMVAAAPQSESLTPKMSPTDVVNVFHLFGLNSGDPNFTTRLDVANTSDLVLPIEVKVIDPVTNAIYGAQNLSIAPRSLLRVGTILQAVGAPLVDGLRITVGIQSGTNVTSGGVIASGTVTDGRTGDAYAVLGQRQSVSVVSGGSCTPDAQSLCLSSGRFKVQATWQSTTASGTGTAIPGTSDTGQFWFFNASNVEMVVKVLNGCGINNRYWVFAGGLTNVKVTMTVTDMNNGTVKAYQNPQSTPFAPIQDTNAFATCP